MKTSPNFAICVSIDRGGTFTDVHYSWTEPASQTRKDAVLKLLSQDPASYRDAPTEGIRRVLELVTGETHSRHQPLPIDQLGAVRLSTTVATNALLERKGARHALLITKGFRDLLSIGNQARPRIFDLHIVKPGHLYEDVVEVDERVTLVGFSSDPYQSAHAVKFSEDGKVVKGYTGAGTQAGLLDSNANVVQGLSGEAVNVIKEVDEKAVREDLQRLYNDGYRSIAVVLAHSYTYPEHELVIGRIAADIGFTNISLSSQLLSMIRMVARGVSTTADAYLTPVLQEYLNGFYSGFQGGREGNLNVEFMGSDGGLVDLKNFSGLKSILSGPAGGVVGLARTCFDPREGTPIIGFDVGGTSTDVSRFAGKFETLFETTTAGVAIQSPQLDINTVAAGGGSCLTFKNGLFRAGPESAGAHPGPACYRKGGPLALTDANLFLGRLSPKYFPKCFGPNENEALDPSATAAAFQTLATQIRQESGSTLSLDEIVYGFVTVANETMARPIRSLTEARGLASSKHILASFGGAGGQHACEIAEILGMTRIVIHRFSSVLSAFGLAMADRVFELQEPASAVLNEENEPAVRQRLHGLAERVKTELRRQGFSKDHIEVVYQLHLRFDGSDTAMLISEPPKGQGTFASEFRDTYEQEFGFLLQTDIIVDDIKVRGIGKSGVTELPSMYEEAANLAAKVVDTTARDGGVVSGFQEVFVSPAGKTSGSRVQTPVVELDRLSPGDVVEGPALIIDATQTIFVNAGWRSLTTSRHLVISRPK